MVPLETRSLHPALTDTQQLLRLCDDWVSRGWLRRLDSALVRFLHHEGPSASPLLLLSAALTSHQLGRGHVCLDLRTTLDAPDFSLSLPPEDAGNTLEAPPTLPSDVLRGVDLTIWQATLEDASRHQDAVISEGPGSTPLVHVKEAHTTRLYLRRFWHYEQTLQQALRERLMPMPLPDAKESARVAGMLATLFPASDPFDFDWQKAACALAARAPFAIITGGPGTGKTTTVVKLLALLQTLALANEALPLRIRLAAPTGKAAARLTASITDQVVHLPLAALQGAWANTAQTIEIPTEVSTLHRLLGARSDTRHFRHHAANPLALDVLVIDEASMVDIEMMTAVMTALPSGARLVLLGDKDQLASVEAGAVLGDLCRRATAGHYTPATAEWLSRQVGAPLPKAYIDPAGQPLDQAIAMLRVSHRFDAESGVGQLSRAINAPLEEALSAHETLRAVHAILEHGYPDLQHRVAPTPDTPTAGGILSSLVVKGAPDGFPGGGQSRVSPAGDPVAPPNGYGHYLTVLHEQRPTDTVFDRQREAFDRWASAVLAAYGRFQLLCALRKGPWGVEGLNTHIETLLHRTGWLTASRPGHNGWYEGRPVLVTANDYALELMNGDIGVALALPDAHRPGQHRLRVAFPGDSDDKPIRWVLPSRLHSVDTVFAMTVHKSQGSEFDHVALVLPPAKSPVLTRELLYTGVTRARYWLTLLEARHGMLGNAITTKLARTSGLSCLE